MNRINSLDQLESTLRKYCKILYAPNDKLGGKKVSLRMERIRRSNKYHTIIDGTNSGSNWGVEGIVRRILILWNKADIENKDSSDPAILLRHSNAAEDVKSVISDLRKLECRVVHFRSVYFLSPRPSSNS